MKTISLIIVNYNGRRFLKRLLETVRQQTFTDFEIIFVDNSSKDDSVQYVNKNSNDNIKIVHSENRGYGYGCNQGAKVADGRFLIFLNEDMYLPNDFLQKMINFRYKLPNPIGGISCRMVDFDNDPKLSPNTYGGIMDFFSFPIKNKNVNDVFIISGSPFFIEKKLFDKIGGFNEAIFIYNEDVDLSWRLKLLGCNNYTNNETFLFHFGGGATGNFGPQKVANIVCGSFACMITNYSIVTLLLVMPFFILACLFFYTLICIIKLNLQYPIALFKRSSFLFKNIEKSIAIRRWIQKNRKKSDYYIIKNYISVLPAFIVNLPLYKLKKSYIVKNT